MKHSVTSAPSSGLESMASPSPTGWESEEKAFSWIHAGFSRHPVDEWVAAARDSALPALRSGHLGNWVNVEDGCAGILDYNRTVCRELEAGRPLIYSLSSTEASGLDRGDWIYLPASRVKGGRRQQLDLYVGGDSGFEAASPGVSIFLPLAFTRYEGELCSLVHLHHRLMLEETRFEFDTFPEVLNRRRREAEQMLIALLESGRARPKRKSWMRYLLRGAVDATGIIDYQATLDWDDQWVLRWRGEPIRYRDSVDLAAAFLDLVSVAYRQETDPLACFEGEVAPLMHSNLLLMLAILCLDVDQRDEGSGGITEHLHWGAMQMAGFPPNTKGYFARSESNSMIRKWFEVLRDECGFFRPLRLALLPVAPFLLCPSSSHETDLDLVDQLLEAIDERTRQRDVGPQQDRHLSIEREVRWWLDEWGNELSPYFLNRFSGNWSILSPHADEATGPTAMPPHLGSLEMQDACSVACALQDEISQR
ncbi:MAG TPA: DUF6025 family protein [Solirubrobacterales bacterium]|nr:DUF6025 family protein [Solirubrobacterales bacterium]